MPAITGTHNSGVVLTTAHYTSPVTIASGAVINGNTTKYSGAAVYGKAVAWSVVNSGTVAGKGDGYGIDLAAGGTVANDRLITGGQRGVSILGAGASVANTGTITAQGTGGVGVLLFPGGSLANGRVVKFGRLQGAVTGDGNGVEILGAGGGVTNIGTIKGASGYGVWLEAGGAVSNSYGLISGHRDGILVQNAAGTVSNLATITGGSGIGVALTAGGVVVNGRVGSTAGYIGADTAIRINGAAGVVTNFAQIGGSSLGVDLQRGGSVANRGLIQAGRVGIEGGAALTLSNYGTVKTLSAAASSYGVLLNAGGTVDNRAGALVRAPNRAVAVENATGNVVNLGTIAAQSYLAVYLKTGTVENGASSTSGGLITAYSEAVRIGGAAGGTIANFGTITATGTTSSLGVVLSAGSLSNSGLIGGSLAGVSAIGDADIVNSGTISGFAALQPGSYGVAIQGGGSVTNAATGLIRGDGGVFIVAESGGSVTNFGTIEGTAQIAAYQSSGVRLQHAGGVANYGTVAGAGPDLHGLKLGVELDAGGTLANGAVGSTQALIVGSDGVYSGGAATIANFGTIIGTGTLNGAALYDGRGVVLEGGGTIANSGTIETTSGGVYAQGVLLHAGGSVVNQSSGRILGYEQGIFADGAGAAVTNFGTVQIAGTGMQSFGVYLHDGGRVQNGGSSAATALISGYNAGLYNTNAPATVVNFGTIQAASDTGRGVDLSQGQIVRNGSAGVATALITAADYGVRMPDAPGTVSNFATIRATGAAGTGIYLGDGGMLANGASGVIAGVAFGVHAAGAAATVSNLGKIAASGSSGVGVALGVGGTLVNFGTVTGTGGTAVQFGAAADRLVIEPGAAFLGAGGTSGIVDGGGGRNTIELAGTKLGIFSGLRTQFIDFAAVAVDVGADWRVEVAPASLAGESIAGEGGADQLVLTGPGTFNLAKVSGFPTIRVADAGHTTLAILDSNFARVGGDQITFDGGSGSNRVTAALAKGHRLALLGGAAADFFKLSATTLAVSSVAGRAGADILEVTGPGTISVAGVTGVETIELAGSGRNMLSLTNANFAEVSGKVITVEGGGKGNNIGEAGISASFIAVIKGGAGADTLIAGRHAALRGGGGADFFELTTPGSLALPDKNTIADFTHGTDKIAFSKAGFHLGSTPAVVAQLFVANKSGSFTASAQRFVYDTTNGKLFYDAHGNAPSSSKELIATLIGPPSLTVGDVRLVS